MRSKLILLIFIISLLSLQSAEAIGLAHGPLKYDFEPGKEITVSFRVMGFSNFDDVKIELSGDLVNYTTMTEPDDGRQFNVIIKLPDYIAEPGDHAVSLSVYEHSESHGSVGAVTKVVNKITVFVPYDGKYLRIGSFEARDIVVGETSTFVIGVRNLGNTKIDSVQAKIDVYNNATDEKIDTILSNIISLEPFESGSLEANWSNVPDKSGVYRAKATVNFDGSSVEKQTTFRIGELLVNILNFSEQIEQSEISPFSITVESKWNSEIKDVYATVFINGQEFKSYPVNVPPWTSQNMIAYIDTSDLELWEKYPVNVTISYSGKTSSKSGEVEIIESSFKLNSANIKYMLIAVVLIIVIYFLHKLNINISIKKKK